VSIESEGATSNVELESALARGGDLVLHETVNLEGEPPSPKTPAEQKRETRLEALAAEIESVLGTAIMRVAALVAEAHELHRYKHVDGGFEGWVERRLKMSRQTTYNLLNVHKQFGGQSVQILDTLPRSVLYLIAPDSVPEAARAEVLERAQAGENLSHAQVKEIVTGHKKPRSTKKHLISATATRALKELNADVAWVFGRKTLAKGVYQADRRALLAAWQKLDPADQRFVAAVGRRRGCDHHLVGLVGSLPPPVLDEALDAAEPELPFKPTSEPTESAAKLENLEWMSCDEDAPDAEDVAQTPKVDAAPSITPGEPAPSPDTVVALSEPKSNRAKALWLWGHLLDFEREGILAKQPEEFLSAMTPEMLDEVHTLAPRIAAWLNGIGALP